MKSIAFIFAIYFLGLNFLPCDDNANNENNIEIVSESSSQQPCESDLCSPFCQCHCCHVHVVKLHLASYQLIHQEVFTHHYLHFNNSGKEITNRILQPPRV